MPALIVHLPAKGKILVKVGQDVSPGDLLAQGEGFKRIGLNLPQLFKVKPQNVSRLLVKKIGEEVNDGEVIAQKTGLFKKTKLKSPTDGVLEKLDEENGILTIKEKGEDFTLKASVAGKIIKIKDEEEVVIEIEGIEIEAKIGRGPKKEGEIAVLTGEGPTRGNLTSDFQEKIVAAKVWGRLAQIKAQALGIAAILGEEIEEGEAKNDFTFLVLAPHDFEKVLKYEGCPAVVWGDEKQLVISKK